MSRSQLLGIIPHLDPIAFLCASQDFQTCNIVMCVCVLDVSLNCKLLESKDFALFSFILHNVWQDKEQVFNKSLLNKWIMIARKTSKKGSWQRKKIIRDMNAEWSEGMTMYI